MRELDEGKLDEGKLDEGQATELYGEIIEVFTAIKANFAAFHPTPEGDHLTRLRAGALGILSRMGPLPVSELARLLRISRPQATALVDGLAQAGHLSRTPSAADRRVIEVAVTEEGLAALDRAMEKIRRALAERLTRLSAPELVELRRSLGSLVTLFGKLTE